MSGYIDDSAGSTRGAAPSPSYAGGGALLLIALDRPAAPPAYASDAVALDARAEANPTAGIFRLAAAATPNRRSASVFDDVLGDDASDADNAAAAIVPALLAAIRAVTMNAGDDAQARRDRARYEDDRARRAEEDLRDVQSDLANCASGDVEELVRIYHRLLSFADGGPGDRAARAQAMRGEVERRFRDACESTNGGDAARRLGESLAELPDGLRVTAELLVLKLLLASGETDATDAPATRRVENAPDADGAVVVAVIAPGRA